MPDDSQVNPQATKTETPVPYYDTVFDAAALPDDLRKGTDFTALNGKKVLDILTHYSALQKDANLGVQYPESFDDEPGYARVRAAKKVPEKYSLDFLKGDLKPNEASLNWWAGTAQRLALNEREFQHVVNGFLDMAKQEAEDRNNAEVAARQAGVSKLSAKWGAAANSNLGKIQRFLAEAPDKARETIQRSGLDYDEEFADFVLKRVPMTEEHEFITGKSGQKVPKLSPKEASEMLLTLRQDKEFMKRYTSGDPEAKDKMELLTKMKFGKSS